MPAFRWVRRMERQLAEALICARDIAARCRRRSGRLLLAKRARSLILVLLAAGCGSPTDSGDPDELVISWMFSAGRGSWVSDFADYWADPDRIDQLELTSEWRSLPPEVGPGHGWLMSSMNFPDDIFMYLRTPVNGLIPGGSYEIRFSAWFASEAGTGCSGIGGAPGEGVYVKAGASLEEPVPRVEESYYRLSVDKGNQAKEGSNAFTIGNIAVESTCASGDFATKKLSSGDRALNVTADATGRIWLFFGTDSAFEGPTRIYFTQLEARITRL